MLVKYRITQVSLRINISGQMGAGLIYLKRCRVDRLRADIVFDHDSERAPLSQNATRYLHLHVVNSIESRTLALRDFAYPGFVSL